MRLSRGGLESAPGWPYRFAVPSVSLIAADKIFLLFFFHQNRVGFLLWPMTIRVFLPAQFEFRTTTTGRVRLFFARPLGIDIVVHR